MPNQDSKSDVFIVWRQFQGRVDAMQKRFDFEPAYIGPSYSTRLLRPIEYLIKFVKTLCLLIKKRPDIVWVQLPPTFLVHLLLIYKVFRPGLKVVVDCHNGVFTKPWVKMPFLIGTMNRLADVILVHNHHVYESVKSLGLDLEKTCILETRPAAPDLTEASSNLQYSSPWVLFPASFDDDEPIDLLIDTAVSMPDTTFVITGDPNRAKGRFDLTRAPANMKFTGWLTKAEYHAYFYHADVVLGLTIYEGVQLSVANEAAGFGKAMVISDTEILRELFPKGAIYVTTDRDSIISGLKDALQNRDELERLSTELCADRMSRWEKMADQVAARLDVL